MHRQKSPELFATSSVLQGFVPGNPLIANCLIGTIELMQPKLVTVQRTMVNPEYLKSLVYNTIKNIDLVHGVKPDAFP